MPAAIVTVDRRPSGRGCRTDTRPFAVTSFDERASRTERFEDRDAAMERAARLAGVKL